MQDRLQKTTTALLLAFTAGCAVTPDPLPSPVQQLAEPVKAELSPACKNIAEYTDFRIEHRNMLFTLVQGLPAAAQREALFAMNEENTAILMASTVATMVNLCDPAPVQALSHFTDHVLNYSAGLSPALP
ncbi:MAG TPA: hypothetical protein VIG74_03745 [Alphaproteobacteria bacterium]|jgi:hypothetical protein